MVFAYGIIQLGKYAIFVEEVRITLRGRTNGRDEVRFYKS